MPVLVIPAVEVIPALEVNAVVVVIDGVVEIAAALVTMLAAGAKWLIPVIVGGIIAVATGVNDGAYADMMIKTPVKQILRNNR
jgi:hypothetical protein